MLNNNDVFWHSNIIDVNGLGVKNAFILVENLFSTRRIGIRCDVTFGYNKLVKNGK
jgi:hypothetical protein